MRVGAVRVERHAAGEGIGDRIKEPAVVLIVHGEAVAVGMVAAAEIGRRVGVTPSALVERQNALIERAGLPMKPPAGIDRQRVMAALALDKKVVAGGQRWVLLEDVGRPIVTSDVPQDVVESVLDDLLA